MTKRAVVLVLLILIAILPAVARAQAEPDPASPAATAGDSVGLTTAAPPAQVIEPLSGVGVITASGAAQFLFQARQQDVNQPKIERFLTRRVQLALYGRPTDKVRYGIVLDTVDGDLIDPATNGFRVRLREAWVGFDLHPNFAVDLGAFRPPWTLTLDDQVSDEIFVRYPLLVSQNPFTPWSQTGGMITGHGGNFLTVSAGLWNGLDSPNDVANANDKIDTMLSVKVEFFPGFRLYLGDWRGDLDVTTVTGSTVTTVGAEHNSIWLGTEIEKGGFSLASEALWNRLNPDSGNDRNAFGYHVSLAYDWHSIQPVLRYEFFDPDNAANADELEWTTLGLNLMLNPSTRLMANYIFKSERLTNNAANDEFLVQISTWF